MNLHGTLVSRGHGSNSFPAKFQGEGSPHKLHRWCWVVDYKLRSVQPSMRYSVTPISSTLMVNSVEGSGEF